MIYRWDAIPIFKIPFNKNIEKILKRLRKISARHYWRAPGAGGDEANHQGGENSGSDATALCVLPAVEVTPWCAFVKTRSPGQQNSGCVFHGI